MKRSVPLKRTPLKPATIEQVRAWQRKPRKPLPRQTQPIAQRGRKTKREAKALAAFRKALKARSGGVCEALGIEDPTTGRPICGTRSMHLGAEAHHVFPSDHDRGLHDPARGLLLCHRAHIDFIHREPKLAEKMGLLGRDSCSDHDRVVY